MAVASLRCVALCFALISILVCAQGIEDDCSSDYGLSDGPASLFSDQGNVTVKGGTWAQPTLSATSKTLFAFAQYTTDGEYGYKNTDVYVRRSYDGGVTWTEQVLFLTGTFHFHTQVGNVGVAEASDGRVVLVFTRGYYDVYSGISQDNGETFCKFKLISGIMQKKETWLAIGAGSGVRTESGRIVFAGYSSIAPVYDDGEVFTRAWVLYSDDSGITWQRSSDLTPRKGRFMSLLSFLFGGGNAGAGQVTMSGERVRVVYMIHGVAAYKSIGHGLMPEDESKWGGDIDASSAPSCFKGPCKSECCKDEMTANDVRSISAAGGGGVVALFTGFDMDQDEESEGYVWFSSDAAKWNHCSQALKFAVSDDVKFATSSMAAVSDDKVGVSYTSSASSISFVRFSTPETWMQTSIGGGGAALPPTRNLLCISDAECPAAVCNLASFQQEYLTFMWGSQFWLPFFLIVIAFGCWCVAFYLTVLRALWMYFFEKESGEGRMSNYGTADGGSFSSFTSEVELGEVSMIGSGSTSYSNPMKTGESAGARKAETPKNAAKGLPRTTTLTPKEFAAHYSRANSFLYYFTISGLTLIRFIGLIMGIICCWGFVAALFSRRTDYGIRWKAQAYQTVMWFLFSIICLQSLHAFVLLVWLGQFVTGGNTGKGGDDTNRERPPSSRSRAATLLESFGKRMIKHQQKEWGTSKRKLKPSKSRAARRKAKAKRVLNNLPAFPTSDPGEKYGKSELNHLRPRLTKFYKKLGLEEKLDRMDTVLEWYSSHHGKKEGEKELSDALFKKYNLRF